MATVLPTEALQIPPQVREGVRTAILELEVASCEVSRRHVRERAGVSAASAGALVRLYKAGRLPDLHRSWGLQTSEGSDPDGEPGGGTQLPTGWRASPGTFAHHLSKGIWKHAPHLDLLSEKLAEAALKPGKRLIVSMPVRHGKSWLTSMWNPLWYLDQFPDRNVILCGHGDDFAKKWGRRVRNLLRRYQNQVHVQVAKDAFAADDWRTTQDGGMLCAGVGGQIMGEGADLLIVDDYAKGGKQARSRVEQENIWEWWDSSAMTRLEPGASVVVVATRWHQDDLIGRILKRDLEGVWEEIRFPALCEEPDELGRQPGDALWPERWSSQYLRSLERGKDPWVWSAVYQQRPTPMGGGLFKKDWWRYYKEPAAGVYVYQVGETHRRVRYEDLNRFAVVDLAASAKALADYTVVGVFGIDRERRLMLLDLLRRRMEGPGLVPAIRSMCDKWEVSSVWIERIGFQLTLIQKARRVGLPVRELHPRGDKVSRALPLTAELEGERLFFPTGRGWLAELEAELLCFPHGKHDDQVDVLSYAVEVAKRVGRATHPVDIRMAPGAGSLWIDLNAKTN